MHSIYILYVNIYTQVFVYIECINCICSRVCVHQVFVYIECIQYVFMCMCVCLCVPGGCVYRVCTQYRFMCMCVCLCVPGVCVYRVCIKYVFMFMYVCVYQVFVELNELVVDQNQQVQWRETARWIKFEEDVEEETERWGRPHVASLSFRSLLELRRTLSHGALGQWAGRA